jgi:integrase
MSRRTEAARLRWDDLDWRAGRSVLRGGASREEGIPLPADAGEALSAYLRQARPATDRRCSAAVPVRPSPLGNGSPTGIGHPGFHRGRGGEFPPVCPW